MTQTSSAPPPDDRVPPRIGLALSGGGFRATLFHLGVVRYLHDSGTLGAVRRITAVSGGSILAAHLGLNWKKYSGDDVAFARSAKELIDFTRSDVRGRIVRRWVLSWLLVLPRTLWPLVHKLFRLPLKSLTTSLQYCYGELYHGATFESICDVPDISILSTSITTGSPCLFDKRGVRLEDTSSASAHRDDTNRKPTVVETTTLDVSYAVAASSAFPPMFSPIEINHRILITNKDRFYPAQYLTDGGVYDNLGIDALMRLQQQHRDLDIVLTSDAEGNFDWSTDRPYRGVVGRNIRASDLLMRRVSQLQHQHFQLNECRLLNIDLGTVVSLTGDPKVADPASQRALKAIRTDLDAFSDREIASLVYHGYAVAREVLTSAGVVSKEHRCEWSPVEEWFSRAPQWAPKDAERSENRKWRVWSWKDPISLMSSAVFIGWLIILAAPVYLQRLQVIMLQNLNLLLQERVQNQSVRVASPIERNAYVRKSPVEAPADSAIVFVHGVLGDPVQTWTCQSPGNRVFWPQLLTMDPAFDGYDIYLARYSTPVRSSSLTLSETSTEMYLRLQADGVFDRYEHITFVAHNIGEAVVRAMLVAHPELMSKVARIVIYGNSSGSVFTRLAAQLLSNRLLESMVEKSAELQSIEAAWRMAGHTVPVYCAYETRGMAGFGPNVVSLGAGCSEVVRIDADIVGLVKPCSKDDAAYLLLKNAVSRSR